MANRGEEKITKDKILKPVSQRWKTKRIILEDQLGQN